MAVSFQQTTASQHPPSLGRYASTPYAHPLYSAPSQSSSSSISRQFQTQPQSPKPIPSTTWLRDPDYSFPSNVASPRAMSQGLLFAPASGEQSMPSPTAIGKLSLIQAVGQGDMDPVPSFARKEDWKEYEKHVIKRHWSVVKEAFEEHMGGLPHELSFPDLPPAPRGGAAQEKPLPDLPSGVVPSKPPPSRPESRQPPYVVAGGPRLCPIPLDSSVSNPRLAPSLSARSRTYPPISTPTSAPAHMPDFPHRRRMNSRRGSRDDSQPVPVLSYVPAPPAQYSHNRARQQRSQSEPFTSGVAFIPTTIHLASVGGPIPFNTSVHGGGFNRMHPLGVPAHAQGAYIVL